MVSVLTLAEGATEYLQWEVSLGRMQKHELPVKGYQEHISPIGAIPKRNKPGKWWLIVDLSPLIPAGASVNDGISPDFSLFRMYQWTIYHS